MCAAVRCGYLILFENDFMRLSLVLLFSFSVAMAQTQLSVTNAASSVPGIVPNSLAQIYLLASDGPIKTIDAATSSVQIQPASGPPIAAQVLKFSGDYQLLVLVPADLPIGLADVTLFSNGNRSAPARVEVFESNVGIFTQEGSGIGTMIDSPYNLTHPALPGQSVSVWTTGLGSVKPTVLLGGHAAPVSYAGPAPGYPGLDQINFVVPVIQRFPTVVMFLR